MRYYVLSARDSNGKMLWKRRISQTYAEDEFQEAMKLDATAYVALERKSMLILSALRFDGRWKIWVH